MKNLALFLIAVAVLIALISLLTKKESPQVYQPAKESSPTAERKDLSPPPSSLGLKPPPMNIDQSKKYSAVLKTSQGEVVVELTADKTPVTVNNFVYLSRSGFYNNTVFHRVVKGFMIQGGDPKG